MNTLKKSVKISKFRPQVRTRHPSHSPLRTQLPLLPFRTVIRLGSTTELPDTVDKGGKRIELNSSEAIKISSNKKLMKEAFMEADAMTADWWTIHRGAHDFAGTTVAMKYGSDEPERLNNLPYPIVAKHHYGSRGQGNTLIKSQEELETWLQGKTLSHYIFEKFYNYAHEFRLHITKDGCFYTCRKALKRDIPEQEKWHFHDDTCVWFMEENEAFFRPNSWEDIVADCVKALEAIGADILAFDVKVQSPKNNKGKEREYQEYILLESNSAPSFGDETLKRYLEIIPQVLMNKHKS